MELKLFSDLIDGLGEVEGGVKAIVNLPRAERETMRRTLDETYRLIDTTSNMMIIRLSDSLIETSNDDLRCEGVRLTHLAEGVT
mgnify:CR=1 FL=1